MSEGPQKPSELLKAHVAAGGWENDEIILDAAGKAFFPERYAPPPKEEVREVIPPGFVKHPEAARYEEAKASKDFERVRQRMLSTLDPDTIREADSDYEAFNLQFAATREAMRQEAEEAAAKSKAEQDKLEKIKSVYRAAMNSTDPSKRQAAEVAYFRRFVEGGDK